MKNLYARFQQELDQIRADGLYKNERSITTPQSTHIATAEAGTVLNMCANNYLGLANDSRIIAAAEQALKSYGFGMASVRFICGTQALHQQLETSIAQFLCREDAILYSSCFDANTGLFETLLNDKDAIISDALNHASVIDGIRLCKAARHRYTHSDMDSLEQHLKDTQQCRTRLIATDGVFSMDGDLAKLDDIVSLAQQYDALVMVDDSHATGTVGPTGRGTAEHYSVENQVDIITSTLGKALGGASGGFTASHKSIVELLRQRSRPYLFSNTLAPSLVAGSIKAIELVAHSNDLTTKLVENVNYFRSHIENVGFDIKPGKHAIIPIMLYNAALAQKMAAELLKEGIYVIGFSFPVVPKGQARIRVQISAAHSKSDLDQAIDAFTIVGKKLGILSV